ncbi:MAG: hypothetical protein H7326_01690 [Bdellovibrionaceae bacterium]|nr:hypothetical protein [Pseudobdellovibrionaceae bacterium]
MAKKSFLNFEVDHMTLLLQPDLYKVSYLAFNSIFGVGPDDILYEKRKEWVPGEGEKSMTYAVCIGRGANKNPELNNTIIAVVQPTEPKNQGSHVREMLDGHQSAAHWQHIALRTPDLLAFHDHAVERGVQFITPILKDDEEDLIQVFSGEWYFPGIKASGMFFEFLQRNPSDDNVKQLQEMNRESWFRDKTFLGLYGEKEREYASGEVTPFLKFDLFDLLLREFKDKQIWQITSSDLQRAEDMMIEHTKKSKK